jgi:hypothetical protein
MGFTSQDLGHKSSKKHAVISGVADVQLKNPGAPLQQLARTDSMEHEGFALRAETPDRMCWHESRKIGLLQCLVLSQENSIGC